MIHCLQCHMPDIWSNQTSNRQALLTPVPPWESDCKSAFISLLWIISGASLQSMASTATLDLSLPLNSANNSASSFALPQLVMTDLLRILNHILSRWVSRAHSISPTRHTCGILSLHSIQYMTVVAFVNIRNRRHPCSHYLCHIHFWNSPRGC